MARFLRYVQDGVEHFVNWDCVSLAHAKDEKELTLTIGAPFGKSKQVTLSGGEAQLALAILRKQATFDWKEAVALLKDAI